MLKSWMLVRVGASEIVSRQEELISTFGGWCSFLWSMNWNGEGCLGISLHTPKDRQVFVQKREGRVMVDYGGVEKAQEDRIWKSG